MIPRAAELPLVAVAWIKHSGTPQFNDTHHRDGDEMDEIVVPGFRTFLAIK